MGLLGAAKNIDFLAGFLKLEKTSKYTDFNPVFIAKHDNFNPFKKNPTTYYICRVGPRPPAYPIATTSKTFPPSSSNGLLLGVAKGEQLLKG